MLTKFFPLRPLALLIPLSLASLILALTLLGAQKAQAGALTNLSVSSASSEKSATTTYTISFTNASKIPAAGGRIFIRSFCPSSSANYSSNVNFGGAKVAATTSPTTISRYSAGGNAITLSSSKDIAAGTAISIVLSDVVNPSLGGYCFLQVYTTTYSTDLDGSSTWGGDYLSPFMTIGSNTNVTGTVTDGEGNAVPFAYVNLYTGNWSSSYYTYADKNGAYGFGDVPAGTYSESVSYYATGSSKTYFAPDPASITVGSSGVTTKNLAFQAATKTISGKVTKDSASGAVVTDGNIYVYKVGGSGWANTTTDITGKFSLKVSGGTWSIGINPTNYDNAGWIYSIYNQTVSFANDATTESKSHDFIVESLNSSITGKIQLPDGSAPSQYSTGVSFSNTKSQWFSATVSTDGNFSARTTKGTYSVNGWSSDQNYSFPKVDNFSVDEGKNKDIGTITLVKKSDKITGKVTDNSGAAVSGASISAWKNDSGYDYGNATSGADGTYEIKVTPGIWQVSAWPQYNSGHVYSGKPESVTVTSGVTATKNFTFQKATNTVNITVTDADGNTLTSLSSWAGANDGSQEWSNIGTSITNGVGTLKVPKGTWDITVYIYGVDYGSGEPQQVTFTGDNETKSLTFKAVKNDATISGVVKDESGNAVTGRWMSIYASKGKYGSWQNATLNQATGEYSLAVSAGTWKVGMWIDPNLGYSYGNGQDTEITVASKEKKSYDIVLKKANATVYGKAKKANGDPMQWAWITADTRDPNEKKSADLYYYSNGSSSNNNGDYELKVPAGTYFVGANMWPGSGYINPKREKVTVAADKSVEVNLTFRAADATISGTVKKDGSGTAAFVTAWSEDSGYGEGNAANSGSYSLSVSKGSKWHVKAVKQVDKEVYKSKEVIVDLTNTTSASQDLEVAKQNYTLPDGQTTTFDPTKQQTISLDDGTRITIPANALATSGTVTVTAEPESNLAEEADAKPLAYGYELNAVDQNGKEITTFSSNVTIENKYKDEMVTDAKVLDEDELIMAYYDKATATWRELTDCTVSESENTVTCQVNHFTKFAIVTAADTTPPGKLTGVKATSGAGKVSLNWTKPSEADFKAVNIYRSTTSGEVGSKVHSNITGTSYDDSNLTAGTTYYYTLRAVDTSGNESANSDQVSAKPTDSTTSQSLPKTGRSASGLGIVLLGGLAAIVALARYKRRPT